ncbi:MAG TPA: DJ-1/PfpI family protein [Steroidobacteraceae bacterium]
MSRQDTSQVRLPSLERLRALTSPPGTRPFRVGILIGPGFVPMDMVGVQTVLGLMPGAEIHLLWKSLDLVEGLPRWWTKPTTTFAGCPAGLDVFAVPMLPPEIQNDPEVIAFAGAQARQARYVIGICNGVLLLGAAGALRGKRVTTSYNSLSILAELGVGEVVSDSSGVIIDGNLYTAGPGNGSVEAALLVAEAAFGRAAAELVELMIEYDPHPPFGVGAVRRAAPEQVARFVGMMSEMVELYRAGALGALKNA